MPNQADSDDKTAFDNKSASIDKQENIEGTTYSAYKVYCAESAYKDWTKLNHSVRLKFIKKLQKLVVCPRIEGNRLSGELSDCYKIKLRRDGFRLVYQVIDEKIILMIWAVDKRDKQKAYEVAIHRLNSLDVSTAGDAIEIELPED